ncbi:MAG: sulfatase-like hydrolase/transferase [Chloracidobacterium sp.]|nr:sulfatase-like hydrolase/transferase [Chloracidobacterium sp.]
MRKKLVLALLGLLLFSVAPVTREESVAAQRPNVLFIVTDDLRTTLGSYGDSTAITPNIDRLARRSLLFTHAYVQQAVCNPSRQSFLSGRRPDAIRVWNLTSHFRQTAPDVISLPEHFKRHGYIAEGIGKIYHDPAEMQDPMSWSLPATFNVLAKKEDYLLRENQAPPDKPERKMAAFEAADVPDEAYPDGKVAAAAVAATETVNLASDPAYADRIAALSGELKKGFMTLRSQNPLPDLPRSSSGQMAGVSDGTLLVIGVVILRPRFSREGRNSCSIRSWPFHKIWKNIPISYRRRFC